MEDLETKIPESVPDSQQPADPAPEEPAPEHDSSAGDAAPTDGTENTDTGTEEDTEADPDPPEEETGPQTGPEDTGSEGSGTESPEENDKTEDLPEETAGQDDDTVSGNDAGNVITISGNAVIFPEDFDLSQLGSGESSTGDTAAFIDVIKAQTDNTTAGFVCVTFLLGLLSGAVLVSTFRLRRV